jgi:hypothetical protein
LTDWQIDCAVVNGENSADGGFGITETSFRELRAAGIDAVTLGNHSWNRKEALTLIEHEPCLIRPINYNSSVPGQGSTLITVNGGRRVLVINALGRLFMDPVNDPFQAISQAIEAYPLGREADAIIVDMHCEATSEKHVTGHLFDGRVSLVVGTHTHVPTADHQILPNGTAFISDVGMTGDYDSIAGMQKEEPIRRFTTGIPHWKYEPAIGAATLSGIAVETDDHNGLALKVAPVRIGGRLQGALPNFWISE